LYYYFFRRTIDLLKKKTPKRKGLFPFMGKSPDKIICSKGNPKIRLFLPFFPLPLQA
jgi:hypothetical protein